MSLNDCISEALDSAACVAGIDVTYKRGSQSQRMRMVPSVAVTKAVNENSVITESRSRDFTIAVDRFKMFGQSMTPEEGDIIEVVNGRTKTSYEVNRSGTTEKVWRYVGPGFSHIKIHTTVQSVEG